MLHSLTKEMNTWLKCLSDEGMRKEPYVGAHLCVCNLLGVLAAGDSETLECCNH